MNFSKDTGDSTNNLYNVVSPVVTVTSCLILAILYVSSLYVWDNKHNRDHPSTVKRRFCSVFIIMLIAPGFVYLVSLNQKFEKVSLLETIGLRTKGIVLATFVPFGLTALLFLGPLYAQIQNGSWKLYFDQNHCLNSVTNLLWIRNHIVAPLSEEFTFRACMMPLILQSFTPLKSVFITPLFFGVAHLHHIAERLKSGMVLKNIVFISCFQFLYTTVFGFYSAYLFSRTGHFIASFVAHAFCNHMGFPDIQQIFRRTGVNRTILIFMYVFGLVGWILILPYATNPSLYSNDLYWKSR